MSKHQQKIRRFVRSVAPWFVACTMLLPVACTIDSSFVDLIEEKVAADLERLTPSYTVTYEGNGAESGSVPVDGTVYHEGNTVTVRGNTGSLVKAGSNFGGWNTVADGSGSAYLADATFVVGTADVVLHAQWAEIDYAITGEVLPTEGNPGSGFSGSFRISNEGAGDGGQQIAWAVYRSDNDTYDAGLDTEADSGTIPALASGSQSAVIDFSGTWPAGTTQYYLIIVVSSGDETAVENNRLASQSIFVKVGGRWIAVGDAGLVYYSDDDCQTWTEVVDAVGTTNLKGIAYDLVNHRLVAVGDGGAAYLSDDGGETWSASATGTLNNLTQVSWGDHDGGRFVAVGGASNAFYSDDGSSLSWTSVWLAQGSSIDVDYRDGMFWATNQFSGYGHIRGSTTGGESWVSYDPSQGYFGTALIGVCYTGTYLIITTNNGISYSSDWLNYTGATSGTTYSVAYDADMDIALGVGGPNIKYSTTEGTSWSIPIGGTLPDSSMERVASGDAIWVVVSDDDGVGGNNIWYSSDIVNWTGVAAGIGKMWDAVYIP